MKCRIVMKLSVYLVATCWTRVTQAKQAKGVARRTASSRVAAKQQANSTRGAANAKQDGKRKASESLVRMPFTRLVTLIVNGTCP